MEKTITKTNYTFPGQKSIYVGKVRDVYNIDHKYLVMVVTDRISAFDVVLPRGIPYKGQVLNQIASRFLDATADIVPNWKVSSPDPMVTIGHMAEPFKVEMVIRGYLTGHAWREYKSGKRSLSGMPMPEGMVENQRFPEPIITPTTKAEAGHDLDISREEIISQGIIPEKEYQLLEHYTRKLFERGTDIAASKGLILVDTKYEFGRAPDGRILLIDEVHTPDSSRYWKAETYAQRILDGLEPENFDKEFVRLEYTAQGYRGDGDPPEMPADLWVSVAERYIILYERLTGKTFEPGKYPVGPRLEENLIGRISGL